MLLRNVVVSAVITVNSDSEVNILKYHKGEMFCLSTVNSDLWRELFGLIKSKKVVFVLRYVMAHPEKKPEKAMAFSDLALTLNAAADILADRAASYCQLDMNVTAGPVYFTKLVKRIQRRLIAIFQSLPARKKDGIAGAAPVSGCDEPDLDDMIEVSAHDVVKRNGEI